MTRHALVDLSHLVARCRHVTQGDAYDKAGMTLQILFRSLRRLHREQQIAHMVFAVDQGSWRRTLYPAYKAGRVRARSRLTLAEQDESDVFDAMLRALVSYLRDKTRCTVLEHAGLEGDDLVARWVQTHPADEHVIVSSDSDFVQLLAANVRIFDGVQERMLSLDGVRNSKGEVLRFAVQPKDGKIKVGDVEPAFQPEAEWWRKALFVKLIRGDAGDNIFAAYPGVRYKGSAAREGIEQAWADRVAQGYHWNNFFQQQWDKLVGVAADGTSITRSVRVRDEYQINQQLIDLTAQPEAIKILLDQVIAAAHAVKPVQQVGVHFLRFCGAHNLPALADEATEHARYLSAGLLPGGVDGH
jgi:hypothetical protein